MVSQAGLTVMNYYLPSFFLIFKNLNCILLLIHHSLSLYLSTMLVLLMLIFLQSTVIARYFILFHYYFNQC